MKKLTSEVLCLLIFFLSFMMMDVTFADISESADISSLLPAPPEIVAEAGVVMELSTGTVLYNKNMHNQMYPASITKIMTTLLTLENCSLDDVITFSHYDVYSLVYGDAHIGMRENEQLSVNDCLHGVMLASANECANAAGEHVAKNTEQYKSLIAWYDSEGTDYDPSIVALDVFAELMNKRAGEAGALNTHFTNPSGLFDENHYTTCYDMARITRAAVSNKDFLDIESQTTYTIPATNLVSETRTIGNRHKMLYENNPNYYEGILGGKTGYVEQSGNTLVTFAKRGDMTLICVVMKSNAANVYNDTRLLLDYGFSSCKSVNLSESDKKYSIKNSLYCMPEDENIIIPAAVSFSDVEDSIVPSAASPEIDYTYNGVKVGTANLSMNDNNICSFKLGQTAIKHLSGSKDKKNDGESTTVTALIAAALVLALLLAILASIRLAMRYSRRNCNH